MSYFDWVSFMKEEENKDFERQEQLAKEKEEYETKEALGMSGDKSVSLSDLTGNYRASINEDYNSGYNQALKDNGNILNCEKREFIKQYVLKNLPFEKIAEFRGQEDFEGYIEICGRLWDLICKECE